MDSAELRALDFQILLDKYNDERNDLELREEYYQEIRRRLQERDLL